MRWTVNRGRSRRRDEEAGHPVGEEDRWAQYLELVEPQLLASPRVHRFASVPLIGDPAEAPAPAAVWVEEWEGCADQAVMQTHRALLTGTVAPQQIQSGTLMQALSDTRAEYVALLRAGDRPAEQALERLGQAMRLSEADVITCDEDLIDRSETRSRPRLRPGPSPDRWLACDDSGSLLVVRAERAAAALPTLRGSLAWRHELALALAGPQSERHAHVPLILCHRDPADQYPPALSASDAGRFASGRRVEQAGAVRRARAPVQGEPSVEVVICFRDQPALLARCLVSLLSRTAYERFSVTLVDNGSRASETMTLSDGFVRSSAKVTLLRDERAFNFAALNNKAARSSDADVLVFLNNDTEIVDPGWMEALLEEALRPEVGAVAPMLLYPDHRVQHAGAVIGLHEYAGHPFAGLRPDRETPFGAAAQGTRNWLAVTAACMMVQRRKFVAVDGFDESFAVAGNDVDLCLRLTAAGHRSLCVPHARVVHDESSSRGDHVAPGDFVASQQSYGGFRTVGDPFYNPSLTLRGTECQLRLPDEAL